ncbi:MAG TPA: beta-ketoacyl-[acyl-carrier-protein] synthase family protein [Nitrospirota bacterium]
MEKAIVTGLGCITGLGGNTALFWDGLVSGRTGISPISGFSRDFLRNASAGEIRLGPDLLRRAEERNITSRIVLFADIAIEEALRDSGLSPEVLKTRKAGLVIGLSLGMSLVGESVNKTSENANAGEETFDDVSGFAAELAGRYGIGGEAFTVSTACAAGTNAIGIARDMIVYEGYDVVICGGSDTLDRMKYLGHSALNTLTTTSIKPFAPDHDGTIFGEGAGILVLEASRNRGARTPYALCAGSGFSCDANDVTAPDPRGAGAIHAMREALRDAGLGPADIGYINLHGSGTLLNDTAESIAIAEVFGDAARDIPVSSIKSAIGHTMGAAGACEAVATVLSVKHQKIPPTAGVSEKHPEYPVRLVCGRALDWKIGHALSNSFGFGGCNGTVIFSQWNG